MKPPKRVLSHLHTTIYVKDPGKAKRTSVCPSHRADKLIAIPIINEEGLFGNVKHSDIVKYLFPMNGLYTPEQHDVMVQYLAVFMSKLATIPQRYYEHGFKIGVCSD